MHNQFYDNEEEFEPRITPKPTTKLECFTVPTVPEISLIFEKPMVQNLADRKIDSSAEIPARLERSTQFCDNVVKYHNSTSPSLDDHNSYAIWRERNYSREKSANAVHISPAYKNTYNRNHTLIDSACMQNRQEDKIYDTKEKLINAKSNNGMYEKSVKFKCSNTGNSYDLVQRESHLSSCNSLKKTTCSVTKRMPNDTISNPSYENKCQPYTGYPYSRLDINGYPFQRCYAPNYPNCSTDNNETVKTLLQLVNSQSEQIKTLQLQVDRLVRMQEKSFRNKSTCACSSLTTQTCGQSSINCCNITHACGSSCTQKTEIQNIKKNGTSIIEKRDLENFENNDSNKLEVALLEQQSKKAFMEQKVSIGVMTSFEFTLQNSPLLIDSEIYNKEETQKECNNIHERNAVMPHNTTESVKKYKNPFISKPGVAQLENIVEDSESYLSSSQQQSSNFNAGSSVRDSEKHAYIHSSKQSNLYNTSDALETSKMYQQLEKDLNQERISEGMYIRSNKVDEQMQNTKISNVSMNVGCSSIGNESYNKLLVANNDMNDYTILNKEKNNDLTNVKSYTVDNVLSTNYYKSHPISNKGQGINVEQVNSVSDSIILSGGDFKVLERPPPTPEPSIHVDMQEYSSDDESDKPKRTSKIGWTFYNNVLGQVNEILQNSSIIDDQDQNKAKIVHNLEQENNIETKAPLKTVKTATFEQLRRLGISLTENNECKASNNKTLDFDASFYPRLECQTNMMHATSVINDTNTSMHMKALALKYLSDEQLADIALQKQGSSSLKHLMLSNMQGTNMSFATMRYLERYQLLPGKNNAQIEDTNRVYGEMSSKHEVKPTNTKHNPSIRRFPFVQTPRTTCPSRILDISTLKQQPKLL